MERRYLTLLLAPAGFPGGMGDMSCILPRTITVQDLRGPCPLVLPS